MRLPRAWRVLLPGTVCLVGVLAGVGAALLSSQSSARRAVEHGFAERAKVSAAVTHSLFQSIATMASPAETAIDRTQRVTPATLSAIAKQGRLANLLVLDADGKLVAASGNTPPAVTAALESRPREIATALAGHGFALTDVVTPGGQQPVIEFARPASTRWGRRVVVSGFALMELSGFIGEYLAGSAGARSTRAYLVDEGGRLIANSTSPHATVRGLIAPALRGATTRASSGSFGHGEYFTASHVANTNWRVVVTGPEDVVFAAVSGASGWLPWALFLAFGAVLVLVLLLVARLVHAATAQRATDRRLREHAEQANRAKSEFLSRMSHELRTPLNAVVGFGQLLELDDLERDQRESVEQILKAGRHLLELINEVLDISRIESGTMPMSLEPVHLASLLAEVLSLIRPLADEADVRLRLDPADLGDVHVRADRHRLKQVLVNVLSNGVKYNREGGEITGSVERLSSGRVVLSIADTGVGIDSEKLDRLFEPFDRLGAERSNVEGTGLGLALSLNLMAAMGGSIRARSTPGTGTTMLLELDRAEPLPEESDELGRRPVAEQVPHQATVVYIEDNPSNLTLVERAFERIPGVRLVSAMQGGTGLELVREQHPDLVLLDLHLPDLAGAEVLERLKADLTTSSIPVVIVSADATEGQVERLKAAGADAYLTKPIDVHLLLETVNGYVASAARR